MFNWDKAPIWANAAAMDESGQWYWYEFRPTFDYLTGTWEKNFGRMKKSIMCTFDNIDMINADKTLEERP